MIAGADPAEKISIALDFVQGKRRVEGIIETATELAEGFGHRPDLNARLALAFELIHRDLGPDVAISYDEMLWADADAACGPRTIPRPSGPAVQAPPECRMTLVGPGLTPVVIVARPWPAGRLRLTTEEWSAALRLVGSITAVGLGRRLEWTL
jgi:hypothetical protein